MFRPERTLTVDHAQAVLDAGLRAIAQGQTEIDLAGLTSIDSTAVAVLLAWQRAARKLGKPLVFHHPPANLQSLANLYGVSALLSLARADLPHH